MGHRVEDVPHHAVVAARRDGAAIEDGTSRGEVLHGLDQPPDENGLGVVGRVDRQPGAGLGVCCRPLRDEDRLARPRRTAHEDHVPLGVIVDAFLEAHPTGPRTTGRPEAIRAPNAAVSAVDRAHGFRWRGDGSPSVRTRARTDMHPGAETAVASPL